MMIMISHSRRHDTTQTLDGIVPESGEVVKVRQFILVHTSMIHDTCVEDVYLHIYLLAQPTSKTWVLLLQVRRL